MRRITIATLLAVALAAVGCGDDGVVLGGETTAETFGTATTIAATTTTATTAVPPTTATTVAPTTTATTAAPTTTVAATTTATTAPPPSGGPFVVDEADFFPDPLPGSDKAHGSGCVIGDRSTLPDGIWMGFVEDFVPGEITFDLACYWTGAEAEARAAADGEEAFDFYVRNMNPRTFKVPISGSARVWFIDGTGSDFFPTEIPVTSWPHPDSYVPCPGEFCGVWLYVNGGEATGIVEQYSP
jgi:hypothetical protein